MRAKSYILRIFSALIIMELMLAVSFSAIAHDKDTTKEQYFYAMTARQGTYDGETLTLKGVPLVIYFSDSPYRKVGHIKLDTFMKIWSQASPDLNKNPPNAVLAIDSPTGDVEVVVELKNLKVDGDDVSFNLHILEGDMPESFGYASMLIDYVKSVKQPWMIGL